MEQTPKKPDVLLPNRHLSTRRPPRSLSRLPLALVRGFRRLAGLYDGRKDPEQWHDEPAVHAERVAREAAGPGRARAGEDKGRRGVVRLAGDSGRMGTRPKRECELEVRRDGILNGARYRPGESIHFRLQYRRRA